MSELRTLTLNGKQYDCFVDEVARSYLGATAIIGSATGENIVVSDASNYDVQGLRIFGKTTQNGTPTPDSPVELVSVGGNGSITVSVTGEHNSQNVVVATPNGLPGIKVTSGGNYTDANGQQWICDEIDFARGVYVQRCIFGDSSKLKLEGEYEINNRYDGNIFSYPVLGKIQMNKGVGLCNFTGKAYWDTSDNVHYFYADMSCNIWLPKTLDLETIKSNIVFLGILQTPIETPLSEEELAAYADLRTYRNNTTVTNDAGAYMELEYMMDAKKYIDSKIAGAILTATVE